MNIAELMAADPFKAQLDSVKKQEKALKVRKARVKAQQAQKQFHAAQAPTKP